MTQRILVVEDEKQIAKILKIELEYEGYDVEVAYDGKSGLQAAQSENIDIILLDVMLPEMNGIEVLRRIRKENNLIPVILLTARNMTMDKVAGLDQGANDYITKPFEMEELLARVRACLRQNSLAVKASQSQADQPILSFQDLTVNVETREVLRGKKAIALTPKEFDLLVYLLSNKNKIVTRENILFNVWGYEYEGETNVIDVFIRHLRRKIDFSDPTIIQTVRGIGYTIREN